MGIFFSKSMNGDFLSTAQSEIRTMHLFLFRHAPLLSLTQHNRKKIVLERNTPSITPVAIENTVSRDWGNHMTKLPLSVESDIYKVTALQQSTNKARIPYCSISLNELTYWKTDTKDQPMDVVSIRTNKLIETAHAREWQHYIWAVLYML